MKKNIEKKRAHEQKVIGTMIAIYCHGNHHTGKGSLCRECQELKNYAFARSEKCPFMATKTFCTKCKVHCYRPEMREKIREVMRYAGPKMLFFHPLATIYHGWIMLKGRWSKS